MTVPARAGDAPNSPAATNLTVGFKAESSAPADFSREWCDELIALTFGDQIGAAATSPFSQKEQRR